MKIFGFVFAKFKTYTFENALVVMKPKTTNIRAHGKDVFWDPYNHALQHPLGKNEEKIGIVLLFAWHVLFHWLYSDHIFFS